jgi:3-dehydroquinate synthase
MKTVEVDIADRAYEIRLEEELSVGEAVKSLAGSRGLMVTDSNVDPLYGDVAEKVLNDIGIKTSRLVLKAGEPSKSLGNMQVIYDAALQNGLDRRGVIIALGGGVVGDIAGFAAATFMRGVRFVQFPTTLLAMVDSAVGGKTAINLPQGKNLVGAFYQPIEVDVALGSLKTLSDREFSAGMAEVIKYGVIWDASFLEMIESNTGDIVSRERDVMSSMVARCCEIKSEIVAVDEREAGVRGILNFGHTLAHSLENLCGYGQCLHGEAVAVGMAYAMRVSAMFKGFSSDDEMRVIKVMQAVGLPVSPSELEGDLSWPELRDIMATDKKTESGIPRFVLAERLGGVLFGCEVDDSMLAEAYKAAFPSS